MIFPRLDDFEILAKPLGAYLIEAGLLSDAQVQVILADQLSTDLRFGEIAAVRGWVKQQTIDYLMDKIVVPERQRHTPTVEPVRPANPAPAPRTFATTNFAESMRPQQQRPAAVSQRAVPKTAQRPHPAPMRPTPQPEPIRNPSLDTEEFEWLG
jgi:hypothetical protein